MLHTQFVEVAEDLELAGLVWQPEIGDEIAARALRSSISILVDPQGMSPAELRSTYLWLPTFEQMVLQLEVRQAVLQHTGLELSEQALFYKTVVLASGLPIEARAQSLRASMGLALRSLLLNRSPEAIN